MFQKFEIRSIHTEADQNLRKYIEKKIGRLDKYVSGHARQSAHAEVVLKESKASGRKQCTCEVLLRLPKDIITISESTINMYAAVDIAEAKLKQQIMKYKDEHASGKGRRHLFARLNRRQEFASEA